MAYKGVTIDPRSAKGVRLPSVIAVTALLHMLHLQVYVTGLMPVLGHTPVDRGGMVMP
jgi:hypothetical protein